MPVLRRDEQLLRIQSRLTPRDHQLLEWLADHGSLTTLQIANALFPSLGIAQRRLLRLRAHRLIDRFRPLRIGGGSYPYQYVLDLLGADVVAAQRDEDPPRPIDIRRRKTTLTAIGNFAHRWGVNQFFTDLAGYARTHPERSAELERWWPERRIQEPWIFGDHQHGGIEFGLPARIHPDGYGLFTDLSERPGDIGRRVRVSFFLEYDTGTEPIPRLLEKLDRYENYLRRTGLNWPILFSLHSTRRADHLHQELAAENLRVPVATLSRDYQTAEQLTPAEAVWRPHGYSAALLRLADLGRIINVREPLI